MDRDRDPGGVSPRGDPELRLLRRLDRAGAVRPANNRVFARFRDALGTERGSTSVAIRTP